VLNTSAKQQQVEITGISAGWPSFGTMLMASPPAGTPISQSFRVAPYGVLIAEGQQNGNSIGIGHRKWIFRELMPSGDWERHNFRLPTAGDGS
jgi:hypothetical protein